MLDDAGDGLRELLLAVVFLILGFMVSVAAFLRSDAVFAWLGGLLFITGLGLYAGGGFRSLLLALAIVILSSVMSAAAFVQGDAVFAWLGGLLYGMGLLSLWTMDFELIREGR